MDKKLDELDEKIKHVSIIQFDLTLIDRLGTEGVTFKRRLNLSQLAVNRSTAILSGGSL